MAAALELERRYDISPAALAFGVRVLAEPAVRAAVADLGRRLGRVPAPASRALDFEKERALRLLAVVSSDKACSLACPSRPAWFRIPWSDRASWSIGVLGLHSIDHEAESTGGDAGAWDAVLPRRFLVGPLAEGPDGGAFDVAVL